MCLFLTEVCWDAHLSAVLRLTDRLLLLAVCPLHRPPDLCPRWPRETLQEGGVPLHTVHHLHLHRVWIWRSNRGKRNFIYIKWTTSINTQKQHINMSYKHLIISVTVIINTVTNVTEKQKSCSYTQEPAEGAVLLPAAPNSHRPKNKVLNYIFKFSVEFYITDVQRLAGILKIKYS